VNTLPVAPSLNCLIFLFPHRIHALLLCLISPPLLNALLGFPSFFQLDCTEYVLFFVKTLANSQFSVSPLIKLKILTDAATAFLQKSYMTPVVFLFFSTYLGFAVFRFRGTMG